MIAASKCKQTICCLTTLKCTKVYCEISKSEYNRASFAELIKSHYLPLAQENSNAISYWQFWLLTNWFLSSLSLSFNGQRRLVCSLAALMSRSCNAIIITGIKSCRLRLRIFFPDADTDLLVANPNFLQLRLLFWFWPEHSRQWAPSNLEWIENHCHFSEATPSVAVSWI